MSISDAIVVMNEGIEQQMDHPQKVYDEPVNLFVAKFLGNPPINVIDGKIQDKKLVLSDGTLIDDNIDFENQEVSIGIRPEFFEINEKGKIEATVELVEHIGRDNMIISRIKNYDKSFRAIVPSGLGIVPGAKIKFSYSKIFVFNKETGRRLI